MFHVRIKAILLALLTLVAGSIATTAQAKQCIYNEAGYVAEVRWFHATDLVVQPDSNVLTFANAQVQPVQDDTITLGFSSCNDSFELRTAVIRIVGGEYVVKGIVWGATTLVGVVGAVAGAVGCVGTAGAACPAIAAAYPAALGAAIQIGGEIAGDGNIPEIFYIGTPSAYYDLKIWGTVFDPQYGDGAPIPANDLPGMAGALGPLFATTPIGRINATPIAAYDNVGVGTCMFLCQLNQQCTGADFLIIGLKCELQGTAAAGGTLITDITNSVLGGMPWMHMDYTQR